MASRRKSFIEKASNREENNPAMAFISEESIEAVEGKTKKPSTKAKAQPQAKATDSTPLKASTGEKPPKGYKLNPLYVETKTKRVQLVVQPSLYDRIKKASEEAGVSLNEYCHRVLDEATQ